MKTWRLTIFLVFILTVIFFPLKVWCADTRPPEEIDRENRAKAKLEQARRKAKASQEAPAAAPAVNYYPRPRYRSYYGPTYTKIPPKPGKCEVRSYPSGAEVFMKGELMGKTPLQMERPPGAYPLTIKLPGYDEVQVGILVSPGSRRIITVNLEQN